MIWYHPCISAVVVACAVAVYAEGCGVITGALGGVSGD